MGRTLTEPRKRPRGELSHVPRAHRSLTRGPGCGLAAGKLAAVFVRRPVKELDETRFQ